MRSPQISDAELMLYAAGSEARLDGTCFTSMVDMRGGGHSPDGRSNIGNGFRPIGVASGEDSTSELLSVAVASRCYIGKFAGDSVWR